MFPNKTPSLKKQPSNPIAIGSNQGRGSRRNPQIQNTRPIASSCPPMKFNMPKTPNMRPIHSSKDPPPMELPPSPPIFSEADIPSSSMEPLSRSLNDYNNTWTYSSSMPNSILTRNFRPSFVPVEEKPDEEQLEMKLSQSYAEGQTIFNIMRENGGNTPTSHSFTSSPPSQNRQLHCGSPPSQTRDAVDELPFSLSLDTSHEDSYMHDEQGKSKGKYSLNY